MCQMAAHPGLEQPLEPCCPARRRMLNVLTTFAITMDSHHTESGKACSLHERCAAPNSAALACCLDCARPVQLVGHVVLLQCSGFVKPMACLLLPCPAVPLLESHSAELEGLIQQLCQALRAMASMVAGDVSLEG